MQGSLALDKCSRSFCRLSFSEKRSAIFSYVDRSRFESNCKKRQSFMYGCVTGARPSSARACFKFATDRPRLAEAEDGRTLQSRQHRHDCVQVVEIEKFLEGKSRVRFVSRWVT